ncbi:hypothetical protein QE152_g36684 [Popillia japonica]|uniref:Uncharacterized protein n=1 Tax=Popillia japonica TaxID=7064 RepID=A0AAW1IBW4_POPJA
MIRRSSLSRTPPQHLANVGKDDTLCTGSPTLTLKKEMSQGKDDTLCTGSPTLTLKKETSQGKVEEVFKTPLNKGQNVLQADTSRRSLRSTGRDTPVESDNEKMNLLDEEENDWQDEEMSTSPIFR